MKYDEVLLEYKYIIGHNCPVSKGVSGSPAVTDIAGKSYLVGILHAGLGNSIGNQVDADNYSLKPFGSEANKMLQSRHFCSDYETVCGRPCARLEDVLNRDLPTDIILSMNAPRLSDVPSHLFPEENNPDSSRNKDIFFYQQQLMHHCRDLPGKFFPDGRFGPITSRALRHFQFASGLTPDGVYTPETAQALSGPVKGLC